MCSAWSRAPLCVTCWARLRPVQPVTVAGLWVAAATRHETVGRRLVHLLKYRGVDQAGLVLARLMAASVPDDATALVPVPRALVRRLRYGVDPALVLAGHLSRLTGLPVVGAVAAEAWWPAHAGSAKSARRPPSFRRRSPVSDAAVLVDDVVTTGATLTAAAFAAGLARAVTATRADVAGVE